MATTVQLTVLANKRCHDSHIQIVAGHVYRFSVTGHWVDFHDAPVNANGNPRPGGIRNVLGWAKRAPDAPWMALLIRSRNRHSASAWQPIADGDNVIMNLPTGILELCANDVIGFYWNNSQALMVAVTDMTESN